jgi:hypothetical protein
MLAQIYQNTIRILFLDKLVLNTKNRPRRTTAKQEVLALIAPLGKLGWFLATADFFALQLAYRVGLLYSFGSP